MIAGGRTSKLSLLLVFVTTPIVVQVTLMSLHCVRLIPGPRGNYMFTKEILVTTYALNQCHNEDAVIALASCQHFESVFTTHANIFYHSL